MCSFYESGDLTKTENLGIFDSNVKIDKSGNRFSRKKNKTNCFFNFFAEIV